MKRLFLGFAVFLFTLSAGFVLASVFSLREVETGSCSAISEPIINAAVQPSGPDFIPEFVDLPNFDDLYVEPIGKLIEILDDGIYRQSDVLAKSGETWLVLFSKQDKYSLKTATAKVRKLKSVSWPGDDRDAKLSFNGAGRPIIAVRNIKGLKPGNVTTIHFYSLWDDSTEEAVKDGEMADGFKKELELNSARYVLRVSRGITKDRTPVAVLVLEGHGKTQVIKQTYHVPSDDRDIVGQLLWAGDLDGDGKLDLYFDEYNEKGYTGTELHLSSQADRGALVKLAATFGMPGC